MFQNLQFLGCQHRGWLTVRKREQKASARLIEYFWNEVIKDPMSSNNTYVLFEKVVDILLEISYNLNSICKMDSSCMQSILELHSYQIKVNFDLNTRLFK